MERNGCVCEFDFCALAYVTQSMASASNGLRNATPSVSPRRVLAAGAGCALRHSAHAGSCFCRVVNTACMVASSASNALRHHINTTGSVP